jgi:hypothetical protein
VLLFHGTPYSWPESTAVLMKEAVVDVTFFSPKGGVASQFLAFIEKHVKGAK